MEIKKISIIFHSFAGKPSGQICTKFCTASRLEDAITCFKFCVDQLRGFGSARSRILSFSLYLAGRH